METIYINDPIAPFGEHTGTIKLNGWQVVNALLGGHTSSGRDDERQATLGESAVVQEPAEADLIQWAEKTGAVVDETVPGTEAAIRFPNGVVVDLDDKPAVTRELESFIREHFGKSVVA